MQFGHFDAKNREYVITNPRTPVKWINYVGTLAFGGFIDHTGGALLCQGDPSENRITKYIQQMPASDFKGTTLYLRIRTPDGCRVFSPFFVPTLDPFDLFECRVGLGYTRIVSIMHGVKTDALIFVPPGRPCELRDIRITNVSKRRLTLDAIPVVEYSHPLAVMQFTNADWIPQTMVSRAVRQPGGRIVLLQYPFMHRDTRINYFTSNAAVSSFTTDRKRFLGDNEYGTWARPKSLERDDLDNYEASRGDNIAILLHKFGPVAPGHTVRLVTQLGQAQSLNQAAPLIRTYRRVKDVERAYATLKKHWDGYLSSVSVETPDRALNAMLNVHNPYQCNVTAGWSRYLSYYQLGLGTRGIGFRDTAQDVMGIVDRDAAVAKSLLVKLLSMQKADGSAVHQFNPLTMKGSQGDAEGHRDRPRFYGDDHLWIVLASLAYVRETGDVSFLRTRLPWYDTQASVPVIDHLRAALRFTRTHTGRHGMPLLGFADWNDTVNLPAGAESLFNANLYGRALLEMIAYARHAGDAVIARRYRRDYDIMKQRFNACAWDGGWFVRYFAADGTSLGSRRNSHGRIFLNGQSWAVLSGFADKGRGRKAMDAVRKHLNTPKGIKLSAPGYDGFDRQIGGVSTYPPGAKENGGIFLHPNPWAVIAETMLGYGDRAWEYYRQINPAAKNDCIDEYECEPYVYAQNILGDEHPQFGLARNSWLSGTASWMYQAGMQYILGIRPEYDGLIVDPCVPSAWKRFTVRRKFRGAAYEIAVENPRGACRGVTSLTVDGRKIDGVKVPLFDDGKRHRVEAIIG